MDKSTFFSVSSPAGSGKTKHLIEYISKHRSNKHIIIVVPTLVLISQYVDNFQTQGTEVDYIDSTKDKDIKGKLIEYVCGQMSTEKMELFSITPKVLICTQKSFINSHAYFSGLENWDIFFDEVPHIVTEHKLKSINEIEYSLLIDELNINDKFLITANSRVFAESVAEGNTEYYSRKSQEIKDFYSDILNHSMNIHWFYQNDEKYTLIAFSVLNFKFLERANSVTFMCANFDESLLYKIWNGYVNFKQHNIIQPSTPIENNSRMKIYYCQERDYSKYLKESIISPTFKYIDHLLLELIEHYKIKNEHVLIKVNNKDVTKLIRLLDEHGVQDLFTIMNGDSRGSNEYMSINNVVDISSTNPTPNMRKFLNEKYSIKDDDIYFSHSYSNCYQAIFRSSIRLPLSNDVEIVVPDKRTANQLNDTHPGSCLYGKIESICEITPQKVGRKQGVISEINIPRSVVQYCYTTIQAYKKGKKLTQKRIEKFEGIVFEYYFDDQDKINMLMLIKG